MSTPIAVYTFMHETDFLASMILECVGEPIRFQIVRLLQEKPRTGVELTRLLKRSHPTISHHLAVLRSNHLVRYRNRGILTFYELKTGSITRVLDSGVLCARIMQRNGWESVRLAPPDIEPTSTKERGRHHTR